ncbi:uncharacterized protein BO96DRAFT_439941 [Aspergillus niger CBS 101883]|uniref:uncharacterized protein n=1 Tax=Aspergillus lacticoffeatus (strain CBS 101883) TaxID=1450533 RepID=UPI000D7EC4E1|nr:uncharacterized protein BO96DRAFT_439941 [Aspergillus niger CBS 101883]PYH50425.1 hypothetical protein BO96DRAFT_439941 [Aspergillus niger CBS 101883]
MRAGRRNHQILIFIEIIYIWWSAWAVFFKLAPCHAANLLVRIEDLSTSLAIDDLTTFITTIIRHPDSANHDSLAILVQYNILLRFILSVSLITRFLEILIMLFGLSEAPNYLHIFCTLLGAGLYIKSPNYKCVVPETKFLDIIVGRDRVRIHPEKIKTKPTCLSRCKPEEYYPG